MKKDLSIVLLNAYGKPFEPKSTVESLCFGAMNAVFPEDESQTIDEKLKVFKIGKKLAQGGIVDFDSDELALIKKRVGRMYGAMTVGPLVEILDTDMDPT